MCFASDTKICSYIDKKNHCQEFINNLKNRWFHTPGIWLDSFESIDDRLKCWFILVQASAFTCAAYIPKSVKSIDLTPPSQSTKASATPSPIYFKAPALKQPPCNEIAAYSFILAHSNTTKNNYIYNWVREPYYAPRIKSKQKVLDILP